MPRTSIPKNLSEISLSLLAEFLAGRSHVLEVTTLPVWAAHFIEIGQAPLGFVFIIGSLVLPELLDAVRKLTLVMVLTVTSFQKITTKLVFQLDVIRQYFLALLIAVTVYQQSRCCLLHRVPYGDHKYVINIISTFVLLSTPPCLQPLIYPIIHHYDPSYYNFSITRSLFFSILPRSWGNIWRGRKLLAGSGLSLYTCGKTLISNRSNLCET